jgi:hypothetical protein
MNLGPHSKTLALHCTLALALVGCAAPIAPPPACAGDNCSNGTPRFNPNPSTTDSGTAGSGDSGARTDAGTSDVVVVDGSALREVSVRGSVGEVRVLPRSRPEDTVVAVGWDVSALLGTGAVSVRTDMRGVFTVIGRVDADGAIPLRALSSPAGQCAIGGAPSVTEDGTVLSVSAIRVAEALAPTGITVDSRLAHVVVEVEDALRTRVRGVRVSRSPGGPVAVAYDVDGRIFGIVDVTGPLGTAVIMNLDAPAEPSRIEVVLERDGRARRLPVYVTRGCVTFVSALAP